MSVICLIFEQNDYLELIVGPDGDNFSQIKGVSEYSEVQI